MRIIGEAKKKSFKSQLRNLARLRTSKIVLLTSIFVSVRLDAGESASASYGNLSQPTTKRILHYLVFSGRWSHTNLTYVTLQPVGTGDGSMYSIVSIDPTP